MSMVHFHLHLIPVGLLCFAPMAQAHPGHMEHAAGLQPGWHAVYHWMEMAAISPGFGIGMMALGVSLYAASAALGVAWRPRAERMARFTGLALGGGGLWLLLG
jgi:hydrogenase/urease accessory protein HupE